MGTFSKVTSFNFNFIDKELMQALVFRFMESRDSSDNLLVCCGPGNDNDQEQDAITIAITSMTPSVIEGYTKENGVTVINFASYM